jgi:hypothetical protein
LIYMISCRGTSIAGEQGEQAVGACVSNIQERA